MSAFGHVVFIWFHFKEQNGIKKIVNKKKLSEKLIHENKAKTKTKWKKT